MRDPRTDPQPGDRVRMTPEQIANWRKILCGAFGLDPWALMCPDSDIQACRDAMQKRLDGCRRNKAVEVEK